MMNNPIMVRYFLIAVNCFLLNDLRYIKIFFLILLNIKEHKDDTTTTNTFDATLNQGKLIK